MATDHDLLERYSAEGCEVSFSELVSRHIHWVHSSATRQVGDPELARDVTQVVFNDLARKAGKLSRHTVIGAWLHRATRLAAAQARRSEQRRIHRDQVHWEMNASDSKPDSTWNDLRYELDSALDRLPEQDRSAIVLRFFEQRDLRSVGDTLGVSEDTAQKRVARALDRLRVALSRRGVESNVSALAGALAAHSVATAPQALAGAVAGGALAAAPFEAHAAGLISIMTSSQLKLATAVLLTLAATVPWIVSHRNQRQLQEELVLQRGINDQLAADLDTAEKRIATTSASTPSPELQAEVLRLRGEVAQLRRAAGRNPERGIGVASASAPEPRSVLTDLGTNSPEEAATTALWAITEANRERLAELILPDPRVTPDTMVRRQDLLFQVMTNTFARRDVTAIQEVRINDDDSRTVFFGFKDLVTGKPDVVLVTLRSTDSGWRVDPGKFQYITETVPSASPAPSPEP